MYASRQKGWMVLVLAAGVGGGGGGSGGGGSGGGGYLPRMTQLMGERIRMKYVRRWYLLGMKHGGLGETRMDVWWDAIFHE